jgi:hypothetical protein
MTLTKWLAVLSLIGFSTTAQAKDLTQADLKKLFPGSYSVTIFNTFTLKVSLRGNGDIIGVSRGRKDTGRWSIEGSRLCIAWKTWTNGRKGCSALRRDGNLLRGDGFYFRT